MALQQQFLEFIIVLPTHTLRRDCERSRGKLDSRIPGAPADCLISDIITESIVLTGKRRNIRRVYVKSLKHPSPYEHVGWVVNFELDHCMICSAEFGIFKYPHHCNACGNLICDSCSLGRAMVSDISYKGPLRVCKQCYWGQEVVSAVHRDVIATEEDPIDTSSHDIVEEEEKSDLVDEEQQRFLDEMTTRIKKSSENKRPSNVFSPYIIEKTSTEHKIPESKNLQEDDEVDDDMIFNNLPNRIEKLAFFGPLIEIFPKPGLVLKTRRKSNDLKVFINICSDPRILSAIPYREQSQQLDLDTQNFYFLLVSSMRTIVNEKDNTASTVFDVIMHPDELNGFLSEETTRQEIFLQAITFIQENGYIEDIQMSFSTPKTASNYKGDSDAQKNVKIEPCAIPSNPELFLKMPHIMTSLNDVVDVEKVLNKRGNAFNQKKDSISSAASSSSPMKGASSSSVNSIKSTALTTSIAAVRNEAMVLELYEKHAQSEEESTNVGTNTQSVQPTLETILKVLIKPIANATERKEVIESQDMKSVLHDLSSNQFNINDIIINPRPGFVIQAYRARKTQFIFVNVCHHDLVGIVSNDRRPYTSLTALPYPKCPYTIGAIDANFRVNEEGKELIDVGSQLEQPTASHGMRESTFEVAYRDDMQMGERAITIDVVIPSAVLELIVSHDLTGQLRSQLATELLGHLVEKKISFDPEFSLPVIPGGYLGKNKFIYPVFNITETEKESQLLSFLGKLYKQGHGVKSWKERVVQIVDNKVKYYDAKTSLYKGEFIIEDCVVSGLSVRDCGAPVNTYPFRFNNCDADGTTTSYLNCYVKNASLRDWYSIVMLIRSRQVNMMSDLTFVPDALSGYLTKKGHFMKNWKKRYFILYRGILKYYEDEKQVSANWVSVTNTSNSSSPLSPNNMKGTEAANDKNKVADRALGTFDLRGASVVYAPVLDRSRSSSSTGSQLQRKSSLNESGLLGSPRVKDTEGESGVNRNDLRIIIRDKNKKELFLQGDSKYQVNNWFKAISLHIEFAKGNR